MTAAAHTANGQAPPPVNPRQVRARLREDIGRAVLAGKPKLARRLTESLFLWDGFGGTDLLEPFFPKSNDGDANWRLVPPSVPSDRRHGQRWPIVFTQFQLDEYRQQSRLRAEVNAYAKGLVRNLTSSVIGKGYAYTATAVLSKGEQATGTQDDIAKQVQKVIDEFLRLNNFNGGTHPAETGVIGPTLEREIYQRVLIDGECFLRFHRQDDGTTLVRFLEPEQIRDQGGTPQEGWLFGIQHQMTPYEDVSRPLTYRVFWPDPAAPGGEHNGPGGQKGTWEDVDAADILHIKGPDTPSTVKRGLPCFIFDAGAALDRAARVQRNASLGAAYRAATGEVWQHQVGTQQQVTNLSQGLGETHDDPITGRTVTVERGAPPPWVRRVPASQELKDPPKDQSESFMVAAKGDLKQAAAALGVPLFYLAETEDGNYSNLESAAAPAVRNGLCDQEYFKQAFCAAIWRAILWAVEKSRLPEGVEDVVKLDVEAPAVLHRNELEKAQEDQIGVGNGWKDRQTCAEERGMDWQQVKLRNDEYQKDQQAQQLEAQKQMAALGMPPGGKPGGGGPPKPPGGGGTPKPPAPRPPERTTGQVRESAEEPDPGDRPDPDAAYPLIADLLYHLYGKDAARHLQSGGDVRESREVLEGRTWKESDHPRGKGGRFIPRGSAEAVAAARGIVGRVLKGHDVDPDEVARHLAILTVAQLRQLHKQNGVKSIPSYVLRDHLTDAVRDRLADNKEMTRLRAEFKRVKGARPPDTMTASALRKQIELAKGEDDGGPTGQPDAGGRGGDALPAPGGGGRLEAPPEPAGRGAGGGDGADEGEPKRPPVARRLPATVEEAGKRLDRALNHFRNKPGYHEVAGLLEQVKAHVEAVGTDAALAALGDDLGRSSESVQYGGVNLEGNGNADFVVEWLEKNGITPVAMGQSPDTSKGARRLVSSVSPSSTPGEGVAGRGEQGQKAGDVMPALQTLRDKLQESQNLPGLERSKDMGELMGQEFGAEVPHFTPEVVAKLDAEYGPGQWIVKSYGDEAYAGFGIFFPQYAQRLTQDAKNTIWQAGGALAQHGFEHLRDKDGTITGIRHKDSGREYPMSYDEGKEEWDLDPSVYGEVRDWAIRSMEAAPNEKHTALPRRWANTPARYMAQPAFPVVGVSEEERAQGVTFKSGREGRVHITTRNGKAEVVPHSYWWKGHGLPVVFEDDDTRAATRAALDAINNLPESERQGQLYAPDIMRTRDGFRVVEANPANEAGASGWLADNPFTIDAYVSHVVGREPAHVRLVRRLLAGKRLRESRLFEAWLFESGFSGVITTSNGARRRYEDGREVPLEGGTSAGNGAANGDNGGVAAQPAAKGVVHASKVAPPEDAGKPSTPQEHAAAVAKALAKLAAAPRPTPAEVEAARAGLEKMGANAFRKTLNGNSSDRRRRREALLSEFGDGKVCPCVYCGIKVGEGSLEQDKIYTTAEGGRYRVPNLVPSCSDCNKRRSDKSFAQAIEEVRRHVAGNQTSA